LIKKQLLLQELILELALLSQESVQVLIRELIREPIQGLEELTLELEELVQEPVQVLILVLVQGLEELILKLA
jgi:hypothetical protein